MNINGFIFFFLGQPIAKKAKNEKAQWFDQDSDKSTKVYVTGLPDGKSDNWGEEEFTKYMSKCGVVDIDVRTNKPKVKLYRDSEGNFKGM
jgi:HIV Tat-specific factor 1